MPSPMHFSTATSVYILLHFVQRKARIRGATPENSEVTDPVEDKSRQSPVALISAAVFLYVLSVFTRGVSAIRKGLLPRYLCRTGAAISFYLQ
jgi:hypothetical protein